MLSNLSTQSLKAKLFKRKSRFWKSNKKRHEQGLAVTLRKLKNDSNLGSRLSKFGSHSIVLCVCVTKLIEAIETDNL